MSNNGAASFAPGFGVRKSHEKHAFVAASARGVATYAAYGLTVRSDMPLHALPRAQDAGHVDVDLRNGVQLNVPMGYPDGEVLLALEHDGVLRYAATFDRDHYVLRFAGCCQFVITHDLSRVRYQRDPSADPELVTILASGALLAFMLAMRGITALHASAVQMRDSAIGIVGASGLGKSTCAALLAAAGSPLVTDDVLRVSLGHRTIVYTGAQELRLRESSQSVIAQFDKRVTTRVTADGRMALRPVATDHPTLPLALLMVPRPRRDCEQVRVVALPRAQALLRLVSFPRLLGWRSTRVLERHFSDVADLAQRVTVVEADVPWGPPFGPDIGASLADLLAVYT